MLSILLGSPHCTFILFYNCLLVCIPLMVINFCAANYSSPKWLKVIILFYLTIQWVGNPDRACWANPLLYVASTESPGDIQLAVGWHLVATTGRLGSARWFTVAPWSTQQRPQTSHMMAQGSGGERSWKMPVVSPGRKPGTSPHLPYYSRQSQPSHEKRDSAKGCLASCNLCTWSSVSPWRAGNVPHRSLHPWVKNQVGNTSIKAREGQSESGSRGEEGGVVST